MVRCPSCGSRFTKSGRYGGITECPSCHARLRSTVPNSAAIVFGILVLVSLLILTLTVPARFGYYMLLGIIAICIIPLLSSRVEVVQQGNPRPADGYIVRQIDNRGQGVIGQQSSSTRKVSPSHDSGDWSYCIYCGTTVRSTESRFCTNCGASLPAQVREPQELDYRRGASDGSVAGNCMVCSLRVRLSEPLAHCPHCGAVAHRVHLMQWLYLHKECPACREHLSEQELDSTQR
jgi:predicted nucleic acid-binding Zn ribbon protein